VFCDAELNFWMSKSRQVAQRAMVPRHESETATLRQLLWLECDNRWSKDDKDEMRWKGS
jgi:hypothetical protein